MGKKTEVRDWIMDNYKNEVLEANAIELTIQTCLQQTTRQQVVNDSLKSFRAIAIDESCLYELNAKDVLVSVAKSKEMDYEQKRVLIRFLIERNVEGYQVDYSYIFDQPQIA
jgi:hypothetical protein